MQISLCWLQEWINVGANAAKLAEDLTLAGLEVGAVEMLEPISQKIVVGKIVKCRPHRSRRYGQICKVDIGRPRAIQIVCKLSNTKIDLKTAVALPGSILNGGEKVGRTYVGGEISSGKLCTPAEIGLEEGPDVLTEFDDTATLGLPITEHLGLNDTILDVELTPNRGDCLSILGIAREIAAIRGKPVRKIPIHRQQTDVACKIPISVEAPVDAPRYMGRLIEDLDPTSRTPDWMKERLRRSGLRSIGPIVDITNFVMLELGQPLHAFDLRFVKDGIVVRHAYPGETLELLDGTKLQLLPETLVIANQRNPIGLAGIMGGQNSGVDQFTRSIFLESAYFRPGSIARSGRKYSLQTDASYRFERGVDPAHQKRALLRASELLAQICNGQSGPISEICEKNLLPKTKSISLRRKRLDRIIGIQIPEKKVTQILTSLDMKPTKNNEGWKVRPPLYRFDIQAEHDVIEEVARLYGFTEIPSRLPKIAATRGLTVEKHIPIQRYQDYLIDQGYNEVITYSFVDEALQTHIDFSGSGVRLSNPIASNMGVMRTTLWPGLLRSIGINYRRQIRRIRLFEVGHVFSKNGNEIVEDQRLGGAVCGTAIRPHWGGVDRLVDFFDVKGHLEGLLGLSGRNISYQFLPTRHPALHPGQSAEVRAGARIIGRIGLMHPNVANFLNFDFHVYLFEIDLKVISDRLIPDYRPVSRFPLVARDISVVISEDIAAAKVEKVIWRAGGRLLTSVRLFDLYAGKGVKKHYKSLSFGLTLQSSSRNLNDKDVEAVVRRIVVALEHMGGQLRDGLNPKS